MNRTKRVLAIGILCFGTAAFSFGETTFDSIDANAWGNTYDSATGLFGAVIQQAGSSLQSGYPTGPGTDGGSFTSGTEGFSLTYDPSTGLASLTVGGWTSQQIQTLKVAEAGGTLDHVGIALSTGSSDEAITISGISINGGTAEAGSLSTGVEAGLFDFAMDPSTDLSGAPFTIAGNIDMTWTSSTNDPQLSATIVGADFSAATPEPGTWALLGSALVGLGFLRRKRTV